MYGKRNDGVVQTKRATLRLFAVVPDVPQDGLGCMRNNVRRGDGAHGVCVTPLQQCRNKVEQ